MSWALPLPVAWAQTSGRGAVAAGRAMLTRPRAAVRLSMVMIWSVVERLEGTVDR